jgi:hypothetical protein
LSLFGCFFHAEKAAGGPGARSSRGQRDETIDSEANSPWNCPPFYVTMEETKKRSPANKSQALKRKIFEGVKKGITN